MKEISFFLALLYLSLKAANQIPEFHYRLEGDQVRVYPVIHGPCTILKQDQTFTFCYLDYHKDFSQFCQESSRAIDCCKNNQKGMGDQKTRKDAIHHTSLPWISFTSISHPRNYNLGDSIPKIVFGEYFPQSTTLQMPLSVEVHHSLMDGIHVGHYFKLFQKFLNDPERELEMPPED